MRHPSHLPIWRGADHRLIAIEQAVRRFPRYRKYTPGTDLRRQAMDLCRLIPRVADKGDDRHRRVARLVDAVDDLKPTLHHSSRRQQERNNMQSFMARLATVVLLAVFSTSVQAQAAQVCRDDIAATAPNSRYRDNGDGTVTDLSTGLIWKQCAEGLGGADCTGGSVSGFTWQQALQHAADAAFAGNSLWRLPNKNELASLVERRCYGPAINADYFPNTPSSVFWSSSPAANNSGSAWYVYFNAGYVDHYDRSNQESVRLVRGGQ